MGDEQKTGVIRHNWSPSKFAQVPNSILYEKWANDLSFRSKGLYATLAGFMPGKRVSVAYLSVLGSERRDAIRTALQELQTVGVLRVVQIRGEGGRITGSSWTLYENPESAPPAPENPTLVKRDWRGVHPGTDSPALVNPQQLILRDQLKLDSKKLQDWRSRLDRDFVESWNVLAVPYLPGVDLCRRLTAEQSKTLIESASDQYWRDNWLEAMNRIRSSAFLTGAVPTEKCPDGFVMTIGLALSSKFVPNMLQGVYHRDGKIEREPKQGERVL